ncbi:hypothetical protein Pmani_009845 [Petrolisthes manimaculis]|uniref:Uncharacterized protein n=1 Tax=Petrolisthes manimaculis TaxID=1843537 RepID=A0AAE1UCI5_9EUCA|nr:hypothetical protein Pmani_009845 [Petrolisthes manimaculis]
MKGWTGGMGEVGEVVMKGWTGGVVGGKRSRDEEVNRWDGGSRRGRDEGVDRWCGWEGHSGLIKECKNVSPDTQP